MVMAVGKGHTTPVLLHCQLRTDRPATRHHPSITLQQPEERSSAAATAILQGLISSGGEAPGIMQRASPLPPSPKTSLACTLPLPVPSSTAAHHLPDLLAGGKPGELSSSSAARQHGLSGPAGQRPP